ncbi:hypothetical protein MJO29_003227, partial [Puccinia striiformis f. sp. tritici]
SALLQNPTLVPNSKLIPDLVGPSPRHLVSLPITQSLLPPTFPHLLIHQLAIHPGPTTVIYGRRTRVHFWIKSRLHVASRKWVFPSPLRSLTTAVHKPTHTVITTLQATPTAPHTPFAYVIPVSDKPLVDAPSLTDNEKILLQLHRQLGHVSLRVIRRMIQNQVGLGLPSSLPPGDIHCSACLTAKSLNKNTLSSDRRHFDPMDIWNVDLIGPFEVPSIGGGKYCLTIRDIGSGYSEVKILERKSEAADHLINTVLRLERQT